MLKNIKIIAFDADDTLWDCQGHFERVMQQLYDELAPWTSHEQAVAELYATERKNMHLLGFGTKAFTLSLLETALRVSSGNIPGERLDYLLRLGYSLLEFPTTPLPEVLETLIELQRQGRHMVVFTKGELLDQEHKLERSGLSEYFEYTEITSDKGEREFRALCQKLHIKPEELLMVGNSFKSDIAPALAIGCWAVHIPFHVTWELEHAETFSHDRLFNIEHFGELLQIL
jgi:putative hydrolase of the HAD superfamily